MPYKDPKKHRDYYRDYMRRRRAGQQATPKPRAPASDIAKDARIRELEGELAQMHKRGEGQNFFPGIYVVQTDEWSSGSATNLRAEPAFVAGRWHHDVPVAGYVLRRGPKD